MRSGRLYPGGIVRRASLSHSLEASPLQDLIVASAHFTDEIIDGESFNVAETMAATNATSTVLAAVNTVNTSAVVSDAVALSIPTTLNDAAAFTDAQSLAVESNLVESIASTNSTVISSSLTTLCVESGVITDTLLVGPVQLVVETGVIVDTLPTALSLTNLVVETGAFTDAQSLSRSATNTVLESGAFTDTTLTLNVATTLNVETLFIGETVQGGGPPGAWTTHLETFAMSRYSNFQFNSLAVVDGVLVGCSENGVYRLDAADDVGTLIDAEVVHDWTDRIAGREGTVSVPNFKLPHDFYVGADADGQISLELGFITPAGLEDSEVYDMPDRLSAFVTNRVPLGMGIRSRYLQPTIRNVSGSDFTINDARIEVDLSDRSM